MTYHIASPTAGFYRTRLAKGAVWTPVLVFRPCPIEFETWEPVDRWYSLRCLINGREERDLEKLWPHLWPMPGKTVREQAVEYLLMTDDHRWASIHAPHLPEANPRDIADVATIEPIF